MAYAFSPPNGTPDLADLPSWQGRGIPCPLDTLTLPVPDLVGATSSLTEQLEVLRQQHLSVLAENSALRAGKAALEARVAQLEGEVQELRARLGQDSSNSSRPPSSDPPQAAARNKETRQRAPTGRKRGGQPGQPGDCRALLPPEPVTPVVAVRPEACRCCGQPFPEKEPRCRRAWRHQVVARDLLPVRVVAYQMPVRRGAPCGKRTRAALPAGVPTRACGRRLTAVVALRSGRYRLRHREVRQLVADWCAVAVARGVMVRLPPVPSAALPPG